MSKQDEFYQAIIANNEMDIEKLIEHDEIKILLANAAECDRLLTIACIENNYLNLLPLLLDKITAEGYFAQNTLTFACAKGYYDVAKALLERNAADRYGIVKGSSTPLSNACKNGHKNIVELLLPNIDQLKRLSLNERMVQPLYLPKDNSLAIEVASIYEFKDIIDTISFMLEDFDDIEYSTLLSKCSTDIVQYLLEKKPLPDATSLIIELCKRDNLDVIAFLNNNQMIDLNLINTQPNILNTIGEYGSVRVLQYVLELGSIDINQPIDGPRHTLLHRACVNGHADMVAILLRNGANTEILSTSGKTPLILACGNHHIDIVDLLLAYQCDITYLNADGRRHLIAGFFLLDEMKTIAILNRLVIAGFDVNAALQHSLIHAAVKRNSAILVDYLLGLGVDINHTDNNGNTPLMNAIQNDNVKIINLILKCSDIDHHITNQADKTAAMMAAESENPEIRDLFETINETSLSGSSFRPS